MDKLANIKDILPVQYHKILGCSSRSKVIDSLFRPRWVDDRITGPLRLLPIFIVEIIFRHLFSGNAPFDADGKKSSRRAAHLLLQTCRGMHPLFERILSDWQWTQQAPPFITTVPRDEALKLLSLTRISVFQTSRNKFDAKSTRMCSRCRIRNADRRYDGAGRICDACVYEDDRTSTFRYLFLSKGDVRGLLSLQLQKQRLVRGAVGPCVTRMENQSRRFRMAKNVSLEKLITLAELLDINLLSKGEISREEIIRSFKKHGPNIAKTW